MHYTGCDKFAGKELCLFETLTVTFFVAYSLLEGCLVWQRMPLRVYMYGLWMSADKCIRRCVAETTCISQNGFCVEVTLQTTKNNRNQEKKFLPNFIQVGITCKNYRNKAYRFHYA